jgi:S-adenosylmethionine hydrolase
MQEEKSQKLWGGRFETKAASIMERIGESVSFDKRLYKQDIVGSIAHAKNLLKIGILNKEEFDSIITGLLQIKTEIEKKFKPEEVSIGRLKITKWVNSYGEGRDRELVVLVNSAGFIEIAATNDSAAALSSANVGSKVTCV